MEGGRFQILAYADDIVLISETMQSVRNEFKLSHQQATQNYL